MLGQALPSVQFSSDQSLSHVRLFATPWIAALQASLSITNSRNLLKLTSIESVMPSSHLILCHPLLLLPSIFPSIRVFSNESVLHVRWSKYWSFTSASVLPMNIQEWCPSSSFEGQKLVQTWKVIWDSKEQWKQDNHPESANPYSTYCRLCFSLPLGLFLFPLLPSLCEFHSKTSRLWPSSVWPLLCWAQLSHQDHLWYYQKIHLRWEKASLLDLDLLKQWSHYQHLRDS